jgi:hypothetical protein
MQYAHNFYKIPFNNLLRCFIFTSFPPPLPLLLSIFYLSIWELHYGAKHPRLQRHARSHVTNAQGGVILLIVCFISIIHCLDVCLSVGGCGFDYSPNPKLYFVFSILLMYSFIVAEQPVTRILPCLKSLCYICVDAIYTVFSICLFVFSLRPLLLFILQILLYSCTVCLPPLWLVG